MTSFQLKLLAITSMTIAHAAALFWPDNWWLYAFGRLAFPIFAWQAAIGFAHTSNVKKYLGRLVFIGALSQPFYSWFSYLHGGSPFKLNVLFTLALGVWLLWYLRRDGGKWPKIAVVATVAALAELIGMDYGAIGVLSIVLFYYTKDDWRDMFIGQAVLFSLRSMSLGISIGGWSLKALIGGMLLFPPIAVLSVLPIALYNGKQGLRSPYLFYIFYPLHLAVLCLGYVWMK